VQLSAFATAATGPESIAADGLLEGLKTPVIFPRLDKRDGYDAAFLELADGSEIPLPILTPAGEKIVARLDDGSPELKYHKFSVVMHKRRRMALFTAANVDWRDELRRINGRKPTRKELTGTGGAAERWVTDERIPDSQQLPDDFYTKDGGSFDKGHFVRRDDVCWGTSFKDIQMANGDTFHTTNCSPQVSGFNQAAKGEDNWGDLEDLVQKETGAERVIVFAGPVLSKDNLRFEGVDKRGEVQIQIPNSYWKIVVAQGDSGPEAFGFVLEQDLADVELEFAVPTRWRRYLRRIDEIEKLLFGLASLERLKPYDQTESSRGRRMNGRTRRVADA
jgi:endonuclease G